jgi:hypothetical protein
MVDRGVWERPKYMRRNGDDAPDLVLLEEVEESTSVKTPAEKARTTAVF